MTKKLYLFSSLFIFISSALFAQKQLSNNMYMTKLPNGLDVLVVEDSSVPLASIMMTFKAGEFTESENDNGLTGLYMSMWLKNNDHYNDFWYNAGGLGIKYLNTTTTEESANIFFTLPKSNLEKGLDFMNSAVRTARMNPDELEKEKKSAEDQILEKQSNVYFSFFSDMRHHLWGDLYSRKNLANREAIRAANLDQLKAIKDKYFYPNNAVLIVAGDVEHNQVFNEVAKIYGDWQASGFDPFKKWPIPEFKALTKFDYFISEAKSSKVPAIYIQWQGPDTRNDLTSTYAADVFSDIINQKMSKFNKALVQSGLALSTNIGYLTLKHVGPISLMVRPNPSKVKECMDAVKKQIALMDSDDYLSEEQIKIAKRMLEIKKVRQEEITSDYIHTLAFWWASASINYFVSYNDNLEKVSKKDVKAYIQKYIKGKPYCAGLMISPELKSQITPEVFFTSNK